MKRKILLAGIAAMFSITFASAQGGQRKSTEERVKEIKEKFVDFKLDAGKSAQVDSAFTVFFNSNQKAMEDMRASGSMDREAMRASRQKLSDERDAKLKAILTADQYKKWKDEIEPATRPQRGQGGPGGNGQQ